MAVTKDNKMGELLLKAMHTELKSELGQRYEVMKKELIAKLDRDKDNIIAGLTLHVMQMVEFKEMQDRIVITLRTEKIQ